MKANARITSQGIICLVSLCLLILGSSVNTRADLVTITFDELEHGTPISGENSYDGVTFSVYSQAEPIPWPHSTDAYVWDVTWEETPYTVMGALLWPSGDPPSGTVSPFIDHDDLYAKAVFDVGVNYVSIEGIPCESDGGFEVIYWESPGGEQHYVGTSPDSLTLTIDLTNEDYVIELMLFGAKPGMDTYFDTFTFRTPETAPLPTSVVLLGLGLVSLVAFRRKSGEEE